MNFLRIRILFTPGGHNGFFHQDLNQQFATCRRLFINKINDYAPGMRDLIRKKTQESAISTDMALIRAKVVRRANKLKSLTNITPSNSLHSIIWKIFLDSTYLYVAVGIFWHKVSSVKF